MPPRTIWRDIADDLRRRVAEGEWMPGDRLPPVRELMAHYDTPTQGALVRAISTLVSEGVLITDPKAPRRGVRVRAREELFRRGTARYSRTPDGLAPNMREAAAGGWHDEVTAERWRENASKDVADRLQISLGDPVSVARYLWMVDGKPIQVGTQYEPLAVTAGTPIEEPVDGTRGNPGVIARFDEIGIHVDRVEEQTRAVMPSPDEAEILELEPGVPILRIVRTHWAGNLAVETANIAIRGDRMAITTTHNVPLTPEGGSES
ncbi:GntR family transcriptional regulator [Nocardia cyriacigeorgica]|uniref:GntR family transcriptional regulator n=1 Tax=Nocardia cyriacigeorgica TaxID=135487 RepID=UPI0024543AEF|nr:GntR family transcriptional regulator [Nocardia cyriacigeorgica]